MDSLQQPTRFVQLTRANGKPVIVNLAHIVSLTPETVTHTHYIMPTAREYAANPDAVGCEEYEHYDGARLWIGAGGEAAIFVDVREPFDWLLGALVGEGVFADWRQPGGVTE